ncbi:MAG: hypothetical protein WCK37_04420 [Candidatus Falkowbacteria bacterium]
MKNLVIIPILLLTLVISTFTSCKPKKDDPKPDNIDTTNPVNKLPVANFTFASETINLKDDSVAVNVTNTSTNATSWYWVFKSNKADQKKANSATENFYYSMISNSMAFGPNATSVTYSVILVAKNVKGDSSYVEKTFTITDGRLRVNFSATFNPVMQEKITQFGMTIDNKSYSGDLKTMTITLPWYLLNKTAAFWAIAKDLSSGTYYTSSQPFSISKDGINIALNVESDLVKTLTIDGTNILAQ